MSVLQLLDDVQKTGAKLHLVGNELRVRAPRGALDVTLKTRINALRSELAEHLRKADTAADFLQYASSERPARLPLSFAQERLWFLDQLQPGGTEYNMAVTTRFRGEFKTEAFERTLQELVRRHETLRTRFAHLSGEPMLVIDPPDQFRSEFEDLAGAEDERLRERVQEERSRPFDLQHDPLFRVRVFKLSPNEHFALIVIHHIICDGWSLRILNFELDTLYRAFSKDLPSPLPALPVQYADYARWQRERLQGPALEGQLKYWRQNLSDAPTLQLPTDHARPAIQRFKGASVSLTLPGELLASLGEFARAEGATLFMVMLAAFQVVLARWSGQEDIVVGSPIAGRNRQSLEGLVGFFVNTLVLRTDLSGDPSFRELLRRVKEVTLGAYEHQDVPFEKIVELLQPARDLSRHPVFQILFNALDFEARGKAAATNTPVPAPRRLEPTKVERTLSAPAVADSAIPERAVAEPARKAPEAVQAERSPLAPVGGTDSKFDLTMYIRNTDELRLIAVYNVDLFERPTIEGLLEHFRNVLEAVVADSDKRLWELPLLGSEERRQLVEQSNETALDYPREKCLHELFSEQVVRTPDAIALVHEDDQLSYAELDRRSNQLAHRLRSLGVGSDTVVGLCVDRSVHMVIALLGILKAGGAYLPLEPNYPVDRLRYMLADAGARIVVTQAAVEACLDGIPVSRLRIDVDLGEMDVSAEAAPVNLARSHSLAYIIYTSGSTGKPKGVMNEHRQTVNYTFGIRHRLPFDHRCNFAMVQSLTVGSVISVLYPALLFGGTLHIISRDRALDARKCGEYFVRHAIDGVKIAPSHLAALMAESSQPAEMLPSLVIVAGEPSPTNWMKWAASLKPDCRLFNHYGATETTIGVLTHAVTSDLQTDIPNVPLGKPLPNCQVHVLDRELNPVPRGVVGEIYVAGDNLTRGYLGRSALTAEQFIPDPFGDGSRLYRTNDLGRRQADGAIQYLGRRDNQMKIRGFRVELGEIEAALLTHPHVRQAIVLPQGTSLTDKRLVGYVVPESGCSINPAELRVYLKHTLLDHMIPAVIVALEALPRTAHGKIERRALPMPDEETQAVAFQAPRTPTEETLAAIWCEVLGKKRVGIGDSFFDLGGHSLMATRVVARVRDSLGVELPVRTLFEAPVLEELAGRIEQLRQEGAHSTLPALEPRDRERPVPLSFGQERLWILDQLQPGGTEYNIPIVFRMHGRLNADAFERSVMEVVRRHEVLRTHFESREGLPVQIIADVDEIALTRIDLSERAGDGVQTELQLNLGELVSRPFDLATGPLFRVSLITLQDDVHVVAFVLHHIISDGWSRGILIRELATLYAAYTEGSASSLPEPTIQYADYAVWQRDWLQGHELQHRLEYWRTQLAGAPPALELPTDRPRPPLPNFKGETLRFELPPRLNAALGALARSEQVTLFMLLLAAFNVVLARWSGQEDIVVGTPIAGRTHRELERLLGFFVNTLALRTDLSGDPSFRELLARTKKMALEAYEHQDFPFEKLVQELQPERDLSRQPLFQVMFALQNMPTGAPRLPGLNVEPVGGEGSTSKFDLSIFLYEAAGGSLSGWFEYATALFNRGTIEKLLKQFTLVLEGVVAAPDRLLSELNASLTPPAVEISVSSTFTADPIVDALWFWTERMGLPARLRLTGFNQVLQSLLSERSLSQEPHQFHLILLRLEDWGRRRQSDDDLQELETINVSDVERNAEYFIEQLRNTAPLGKGYCLVGICPASPEALASRNHALRLQVIEQRLIEACKAIPQVRVVALDTTTKALKLLTVHDAYLDKIAQIPYAQQFFAGAATGVIRSLLHAKRHVYKVVVVDCDNTLWKGICGEDGPTGISITPGRRLLQESLVQLAGNGVLVCICSRNNEADVREVFETNSDMVLSLDEVASYRIGWGSKPVAMAELASELNLALNSFVFLDDDPVECARMEAEQPDVLTLALPTSDEEIVTFLDRLWMFDGAGSTPEDRKRTQLYREERQRRDVRQQSRSMQDFVRGLELKITPRVAEDKDVDRVVQIMDRTTQFNTTGLKLRSEDVRQIIGSAERRCLIIELSDRFGDYGKSGLLILRRSEAVWQIEQFALSCRVLGRDVEFSIVEGLVQYASQAGASHLSFEFHRSSRNMPAQSFLRELYRLMDKSQEPDAVNLIPLSELSGGLQRRRGTNTPEPVEAVGAPELPAEPTGELDFKAATRRFSRLVASEYRTVGEIMEALNVRAVRPARKSVAYEAPRTPTEEVLAGIWCEVLQLEQVGVNDNFFDLGGHSLLATQVVARVRDRLGVELPLRALFEAPTVAACSLKILELKEAGRLNRESDLKQRIASLSPEEVRAALRQMKAGK